MPQGARGTNSSFPVEQAPWLTALLAVVTALVYWPSFSTWFFLDDFRIILENPALHNAFDPSAVWQFSKARFIASWTLAANYTVHGEQVFGYHLVNFAIHLGAGFGLWLLLRGLLGTPALRDGPDWLRWVPWIAAALFLLHPLQTQAVTYIVQRYTSLMAMFYLLALATWVHARLRASWRLYLACATCAGLAMFSKQTAATLPLALVLVELLFFRRPGARAWAATLALAALTALACGWLLMQPGFDIVGLTRETGQIGRVDYLATQMDVLWRYLGLLVFIGEQRLEYDLPLADGFSLATWMYAAGHLALIGGAAALWRRLPLVTFGVLFYYLAHVIESSFLPIIDLVFEHRTYLPNAGALSVVALGLAFLVDRLRMRHFGAIVTLSVLLAVAVAGHARNRLWADHIAFLQHETQVSPDSQRAWTSLGKELMREQRFDEALQALERAQAIALASEDGRLRPPTLLNMIFALHYTGNNARAVTFANAIDTAAFNATETAFFHEARGRALLAMGRAAAARDDLEQAARINPSIAVVTFLAAAELELGNRNRAHQLARQVLNADPANRMAREILGNRR
ncbi:MAG: hypothetical protein RQ729_08000 [Wenzhouxiangellaceae bacterium]|nr:hypothetical protein [Wenzhouxiangellaceae bacterium]